MRNAAAAAAVAAALALSSLPLAGCLGELTEPVSVDTAEVLGGRNVPAGKWPDVAAVLFDGQQGCTGTLIAPTIVLTAGHCSDPTLDRVLIGTTSLARVTEGETIRVMRRVVYPRPLQTADLAVLILERASRFAPRPIATGWARFDIANGAAISLVGYGAIDRDGDQYINDLQEAETTITDADCTEKPGCNGSVAPGGELGAGGMGIDTCPGDSGGPLYLVTSYGAFLAGVTSRAYDDASYACTDGGIYVRPDKFIAWIEQQAEVPVAQGPAPTAASLSIVRGRGAETTIEANDPTSSEHTYRITAPPARGTASVRRDGRLRVCADPAALGDDAVTVAVTDARDAARSLEVQVPISILDGDPDSSCSPDDFEEGGGCCDSGRGAGGSLPLAIGVLAVLLRGRRRAPRA